MLGTWNLKHTVKAVVVGKIQPKQMRGYTICLGTLSVKTPILCLLSNYFSLRFDYSESLESNVPKKSFKSLKHVFRAELWTVLSVKSQCFPLDPFLRSVNI